MWISTPSPRPVHSDKWHHTQLRAIWTDVYVRYNYSDHPGILCCWSALCMLHFATHILNRQFTTGFMPRGTLLITLSSNFSLQKSITPQHLKVCTMVDHHSHRNRFKTVHKQTVMRYVLLAHLSFPIIPSLWLTWCHLRPCCLSHTIILDYLWGINSLLRPNQCELQLEMGENKKEPDTC